MKLNNKNIGIGITGSFCTFNKILDAYSNLAQYNVNLIPILSYTAGSTDNRFMTNKSFLDRLKEITKKEPITTITDAEPIGPKSLLDIMLIAPCTGNTIAKLVNGITDTPVLMAAKAHLRNNKPLVIAISTNDALGINFKNIGMLLNMKNIYLVPFYQDDYIQKPTSMIANTALIIPTLEKALDGLQYQPIIFF